MMKVPINVQLTSNSIIFANPHSDWRFDWQNEEWHPRGLLVWQPRSLSARGYPNHLFTPIVRTMNFNIV